MQNKKYGDGDTSYICAGKQAGIEALVNDFYHNMSTLDQARSVRSLYPENLDEAKKRLSYFLCSWLGGPRLYREHFGPINIPKFHSSMHIDDAGSDAWLMCMDKAIQSQGYDTDFCEYLMAAFRVPANRIVGACTFKG